MTDLTLYGWTLCPFAQRVRFCLESLKINYVYKEVDLFSKRENEQWYLDINPFGKVPSLKFKEESFYESLLLLEFIEDQFGGVFPKDTSRKTHQRIWANYFNEQVINKVWAIFALLKTQEEDKVKLLANQLAEGIRYFTLHSKLSERVKKNPHTFFEGDSLTYVDFAIIPHTQSLMNFYSLTFKKDFFDLVENDELIKDFKQYYSNVIATDSFIRAVYKPVSLPPKGDSFLLDQFNYTPETFDYNHFFEDCINKTYLE